MSIGLVLSLFEADMNRLWRKVKEFFSFGQETRGIEKEGDGSSDQNWEFIASTNENRETWND